LLANRSLSHANRVSGRGLHRAPGNGFRTPETEGRNPPPGGLHSPQRPHTLYVNPRKPPLSAHYSSETRKRRFVSECVVVDAAPIEPVSTGQFPSIREKNREFCKFEGIATTCPRANTRHFRRFSAKFPVRIEPGILLSNREFFLSNRETFKCENGKSARSRAYELSLPGREKRASPAMHGPFLLEETFLSKDTCQGETETRIPESLITSSAGGGSQSP
jgi:hypothetical protein